MTDLPMRPTCGGTKKSGEPCTSTLGLSAAGLCLNHDPERAAAAREIRAAGGRATGAAKRAAKETRLTAPDDVPAAPRTLDDAVRYFAYLTHAVASGKMDARAAHEAAYSLNGFKAAVEKRDLEREIKALQKQLTELKQGPRRAS
jgi:hypothetical protein